jgi:hypothetical protein
MFGIMSRSSLVAALLLIQESTCQHCRSVCDSAWQGDCDSAAQSLLQRQFSSSHTHTASEDQADKVFETSSQLVPISTLLVQHGSDTRFVTSNDLTDLVSSLVFNGVLLCFHIFLFCMIRFRYPKLYSRTWLEGLAPCHPGEGFCTWVSTSMRLTPEEVIKTKGLDAAMVLKFHDLCIKILLTLGLPMVLIMCPMHYRYGDAAEIDPMSQIDMTNMTDGCWLYWIHAMIVWIVVVTVQRFLFSAQADFLSLRYTWLRNMSHPRATTLLVQNIPKKFRTDEKLQAYVNSMLMRDAVQSAYVVRYLPEHFCEKLESMRRSQSKLEEAERRWDADNKDPSKRPIHFAETHEEVDTIDYYKHQVSLDSEGIRTGRQFIASAAKAGDATINSLHGFVTFKERHDAEVALCMRTRASADEVVFSMPPDPTDVKYDVLQHSCDHQRQKTLSGFALMTVVFVTFLPITVWTSLVTSLDTLRHVVPLFDHIVMKYPMATSLWDGVVGSAVLTILMSFVPTLLMLIIRRFFGLASESWCQHRLQHWYFNFLILFVLLIYCIGNSLFTTYLKLAKNPTRFFNLLASTLPQTAHFYVNFLIMQWGNHGSHIVRYMNLVRFHYYKRTAGEDLAWDLAEPEDQDYYGNGARAARFALFVVIALVFCTVCPVICLVALVDSFICRVVSGYLLVFAETTKPDSGGQFWCTQVKHLQHGLFLYITLMVGILTEKYGAYGPGLVAAGTYIYLMEQYKRLEHQFPWSRLPFEELVALQSMGGKTETNGCYMQSELVED